MVLCFYVRAGDDLFGAPAYYYYPGDARCDSRQPCAMRVIIGFRAVSVSQALRAGDVFLLISKRNGDVGEGACSFVQDYQYRR